MIYKTYGDLSMHAFLQNRNAELNRDIATLSKEMSTGKKSDLTAELGGDFSFLADIEDNLKRIDSQIVAANETELFAISMQGSLSRAHNGVREMRDDLLSLSTLTTPVEAERFSDQGRQELASTIGAFNTWSGGRSLFAGTATGTSPLNSADTLMTELVGEVSGLTDVADIIQAVKDWFDDPTGFDTAMYVGSTTDVSPVEIGDGDSASLSIRADDERLKHALQSFAILSLVSEPGVTISDQTKVDIVRASAAELADSDLKLISAQADVGFVEEQLDRAKTRNEASKTSLSLAFNEIVLSDPYETTSRFEASQNQLEILYTVTARSSRLSLVNFL